MRFLFIIVLIFITNNLYSQQNSNPFISGEKYSFDIYFGFIKAGSASLEVFSDTINNSSKNLLMIGKGKTAPFFDYFFKVRDEYRTIFDCSELVPIVFDRNISEGRFKLTQRYLFDHSLKKVTTNDTVFRFTNSPQDMLSALFFARTINRNVIELDTIIVIPIFMDNEMFNLEIKYLKTEILRTPFGGIECLVFQPSLQKGRVFEDGESMKIWISNDANKSLIRVETKIWAGTIKAVLKSHEGLQYPLSIND
mgnify:FL=1